MDLPQNYSAPNALKSAWLILQGVVDKNKNPALEVCTKASIANSMLNMVIQGLNPAKKQCYFIVYGKTLTLMPSYLGNKAVCLRVDTTLLDIYAECVYEGDTLEYSILMGQRVIKEHSQSLANVDNAKIIGAYAIAVDKDNKPRRTELMTMAQLKTAWNQSPTKPITEKGHIKAGSTHAVFTDEMAKKTVTNRLTKHIIGSSDDDNLVIRAYKATDDEAVQAEAQEEVEELAGTGEVIDIKAQPREKEEPKPKTKKPAEKKAAPDPKQKKQGPEMVPGSEASPDPKADVQGESPPMTDAEKEEILRQEMAEELDKPSTRDHIAQGPGPGF